MEVCQWSSQLFGTEEEKAQMCFPHIYTTTRGCALPLARHVYKPCRLVSLGDHRVRTATLDLSVWDPDWLCHIIHCTLSTEPMAEAATGTKGYPSLGQRPRDA